MNLDLSFAHKDHFALFGLPRTFALDRTLLDQLYRDIQARVHPDKHAHLSDADRRVAMQWATQVNEAYQTLLDPLKRARYLLHLEGHDPRIETNTAMPAEFLIEQMEMREAVAEARSGADAAALDELHRRVRKDIAERQRELAEALDVRHDYLHAGEVVRRLMFDQKLLADVDAALEAVEA